MNFKPAILLCPNLENTLNPSLSVTQIKHGSTVFFHNEFSQSEFLIEHYMVSSDWLPHTCYRALLPCILCEQYFRRDK